MIISLQGQLAVAAETSSIQLTPPDGITIQQCIVTLAATLPAAASDLLVSTDGSLRKSLFIAIDSNHIRNTNLPLPSDTAELTLMPPMAGG